MFRFAFIDVLKNFQTSCYKKRETILSLKKTRPFLTNFANLYRNDKKLVNQFPLDEKKQWEKDYVKFCPFENKRFNDNQDNFVAYIFFTAFVGSLGVYIFRKSIFMQG